MACHGVPRQATTESARSVRAGCVRGGHGDARLLPSPGRIFVERPTHRGVRAHARPGGIPTLARPPGTIVHPAPSKTSRGVRQASAATAAANRCENRWHQRSAKRRPQNQLRWRQRRRNGEGDRRAGTPIHKTTGRRRALFAGTHLPPQISSNTPKNNLGITPSPVGRWFLACNTFLNKQSL